MLTRRQFAISAASLMGTCTTDLGRKLIAEEPSIANQRLIRLGLNALARSPEMNYFADGHRGAAMISAHLMCVDNQLEDAAAARISELFDLNWAPSKLCKPFPDQDPIDDAAKKIGEALAAGGGVLRQVGHDAIFAMHAIKGFRLLPETATPERVDGVCNLIRAFTPWRDIAPADDVDPPAFSDAAEASRFILQEASDAVDRFSGFGQGFAGHMLTFGQSLVELAAMGDVEWAESCRTSFRKYVTVTRMGPQSDDRKIKDHAVSQLRPNQVKYWKQRGNQSLGIGHVFKYPYAYYDLMERANTPELEQQFEEKAWQIF